jgi:uncharacterized protein YjiK
MIVSENTQTLEFKIGYKADSVDVSIVNETTKEEVYNKPRNVSKLSYYNTITDNSGFNFTDQNNYILELRDNGTLVYRATIYCFNELPNQYHKGNRINTDNEYITI